MNAPSLAGDLPSRSGEDRPAAPLFNSHAASSEASPERAPLDIGLDVMVTAEGLAVEEELPRVRDSQPRPPSFFRRRAQLPLALFLLTSLSLWFAGATRWVPHIYVWESIGWNPFSWDGLLLFYYPNLQFDFMEIRQVICAHWSDGVVYMICAQLILFSHEMGHFLYAVYYRVRCTLPFFIPLPMAFGTMGAVIAMEGHKANRRQIFDIGIAGPIAGLCLTIPILWLGAWNLELDVAAGGGFALDLPLAMRWVVDALHPGKLGETNHVWLSQANPYFIAGWFGLILTALNMMPVSQLDGGHVTYTLWGKGAHWVARAFMVFVFAYIVFAGQPAGSLMAVLVMFMGTDHPPTSDDQVPLGWFRILLGHASLIIPILCFTPKLIVIE
jgi:Zn-dependent protease